MKKRRLRRILITLSVLATLASGALLIARTVFAYYAEQRVAEVAAALDRDDPGWRWEDIRAKLPKLPPEENSAPLVKAAAELLPKKWPEVPAVARKDEQGNIVDVSVNRGETLRGRIEALEPNIELPPDLATELQDDLKALQPALLASRRLIDAPMTGQPTIAWTKDFYSTLIPHPQSARTLSTLLALDAASHAHDRRGAEAMRSCKGIVVTGRSIGLEPVVIHLLARNAIASDAAKLLERTLGQTEPDREVLAMMQELLRHEALELQPLMRASIRGERAIFVELLSNAARGEFAFEALSGNWKPRSETTGEAFIRWLYLGARLKHCQALAAEAMNKGVRYADNPPREQYRASVKWSEEIREQDDEYKRTRDWRRVAMLNLPAIQKIATAHHRARVRLHSAMTALAAERYRLQHNRWPDALTDLVPDFLQEVPEDVFSDDALRMKKLDDGLVIYSLGDDFTDEGGLLLRKQAPGVKEPQDVGFRLYNPATRRQPAPQTADQPRD